MQFCSRVILGICSVNARNWMFFQKGLKLTGVTWLEIFWALPVLVKIDILKERQTIKYHLVEFYYSIKCSYKYMKYITSGFISKTSLFRSKPDRKLLISDKSGLCGPNFYHKCYFSWWNEMISTRKWSMIETGCTGKVTQSHDLNSAVVCDIID